MSVFRGFLESFQESVGGGSVHALGISDHGDLFAGAGGRQSDSVFQIGDLVDEDAARFGFGADLDEIGVLILAFAGEAFDKTCGELRFPGTGGASDEVGVGDPVASDELIDEAEGGVQGNGHGDGLAEVGALRQITGRTPVYGTGGIWGMLCANDIACVWAGCIVVC